MIYILNPMLDDPRFDGFEAPMGLFRSTPGGKRTSLNFEVTRLAPGWVVPQVKGIVREINHYPCINLGIPAFSAHAVQCLKEMLSSNGELLPLRSPCGEFYFYNVTTVADVLDVNNSVLSWLKPGIIAGEITFYSFFLTDLDKLTIFRIPQNPPEIYVTERFVDLALRSNLTGMRFKKVWPINPDMRPQLIEVPLKDAGMTVAQATAQSVYLYLLPADNGRINVENVNAMVEQLGRSFIPSEGHMFSAGHIVSIEEGNGAYRLMFSCPDALPLAKTLKKYLDEMKWTGTYRIMMRLGKYYDDVVAKELAEA